MLQCASELLVKLELQSSRKQVVVANVAVVDVLLLKLRKCNNWDVGEVVVVVRLLRDRFRLRICGCHFWHG